MLPLAALTGPLPKAGVVVAAGLVAIVLLHPDSRARAGAMLAALLLAPALLLVPPPLPADRAAWLQAASRMSAALVERVPQLPVALAVDPEAQG